MERRALCAGLYWLLLPLALLAACLFRFNVLSLVYLLFLLLLPWFPGPTQHSAGGHTSRLLKALLGTSILFLLAHFVFQICLYTLPILDQLLGPSCSTWEVLARHIGVTRLDLSDIPNSVRLVAPDVGILLASSLCLCLCRRLVPKAGAAARGRRPESVDPRERGEEEDVERRGGTADGDTPLSARLRVTAHWLLWAAGKGLAILLLALAGITLPSASSSVYYLLFVGLCTWWACHLPTSRLAFDTLCFLVGVYAGGHLLCLYAYQTPFVQGVFPPPTIWARLFGFKDVVLYRNCSRPNALVLNTGHPWPVYANPGILLLLYYTVATLVKLRRLDARRTAVPAQPPARCSARELVELESWPKDTDGVAEDTKPMLSPSTGKPGSGAENCTVHVMGNSPQPGRRRPAERLPLHALGHVIMNQSYVCALIAMMVWSITYHSWLTFVLLLWACLIWTVRSRHHFAMLCSPFLLLYGIALCSLQYVWGMDLAPELPTRVGFMSLEQLGLVHPKYPCLDLGAKLLLTLTFWLLLRQFVKEKLLTRRCPATPLLEVTVSDTEPSRQRDVLKALGVLVRDFYAKYWICVCAGMFIVVSFAGRLVVYKIVYMFLFLLCLTLFQVYYSLWRKVLKGFWWLVVAYTMLVLIAVYTFQFEDFPMYWRNLTGLTDEQLGDLGLEQFSVSELFSSTLIPGFFLLACILQLHYFHRPFMHITDLEHIPAATMPPCHIPRPEELHGSRLLRDAAAAENAGTGDSDTASQAPTKWGLVLERLIVLGWTFSDTLTRGQVFVGRLLELHILKLVALYTVWVALQEVSLMNFLLVLLWAFAMPYCRFRHMASCLSTVWTCIIIVCKMLYQLKIVDPSEYSSNCTQPQLNGTNLSPEELGNSTLYRGPVDPANWFGIRKGYPNLGYIQNHLLVLLLLVFEAVVYRRQEYYRKQHQLVAPVTETIFEDISREHLDHGLGSCAKYFLNYFYYKFGLEICFLMTVNVVGQRMNFMVILHGCWLVVILTRRRRAAIARLWPKYCLFLVVFLLYQYLLCVGMPPALCVDYPWRWTRALPFNSALIKWLYLPDFFVAPKSTNLINDFALLLCAAQQWRVFEAEGTEEWLRAAGENTDRLDLARDPHNPTPNFIHCRSYLDMAKVVVFRYLFWFVLVVVFITGATRISLFGLGYLLACFYLLLFGTAMLRKPARARLVLWDCLILYNITVIISKNMLSLLSCVFVQQMQSNFCWVIQLFSLVCTVKGYYDPKEMGKDQDCSLPVEEAGIIWDSICFFFLLLQRRVFLSYYYLHVMLDLQASALQASRGVALFKASTLKSMRSHRQAEKKSLAQLKRQMERIRAKQEKYHQERLPRGTGEGQDEARPAPGSPADPSRQRERWWRPWLDHAAVLHSGEYFLFESDSEEEEEAAVPEEPQPGRQSAFQLAYQAWVTNTRTALRQQEQPEAAGAEVAAGDSGGREEELEAPEEAEGQEEEEEEGSERGNVVQRVLNTLRFLWVLCRAMVDGLTQWLDACTREHTDMSTVLCLERYVLTRRLATGEDVHRGVLDELYLLPPEEPPAEELSARGAGGADPQNGVASSGHQGATPGPAGCPLPTGSQEQVTISESQEDVAGSQELLALPQNRSRTASELLLSRRLYFPELEESERFYRSHNRFLKLLLAGYRCVAAHSELLCYFIIILNNMVTASVISLFLPILVFLWAMLSIPRPTKRFWMTAIIFTEVMVVVKYLFQFGFFPWNGYTMLVRNEGKPFFPPRILGLEKTDRYIKYDLIQLLALFFHRSLLLSYGLWDHEEDSFPKKKAERVEDEEEEERREEAASPVGEEGTEVPAEPGAPGAAAGPEPEGDAVGQEKGAGATQLRFRRKRRWGKKQPEAAPEEGDGEEEEEEEEEAKQSHAQKKLKAFGLQVKLFFLTMAQNMYRPVRGFFWDILHTQHRAATDVYAFMFLADVVDFIIIIFGFWAFGKHSAAADITSSLSDDQVPEAFLVMLLIQFTTMVIDRALYLRKTVLGKLIFQVILVFSIHLWMFFILPAVTERLFSLNTVAQLWYFVKCIYFSLSAYQIRCGYPTRILGNFLTKKYNHLNLFLFQGFRLVPFLVELRAVMDWVWTDTTLSLSNWMCVEDIYANIFIIKCSRETEKKYPQPKGQKKKKIVKYGMGGLIILFLVAIIWFPLLFMSLVRSVVGVVNHPIDVTVTLKLGGYEPLFTMSAQQQSIQPFTPQDYEALTNQFERQPVAMQFITLYGYEDIVRARIEGSSGSLWSISPPSREQMRRELQNGSSDITLRLTWTFQRDLGKGGTVEHTFDKHTTDLQPGAPQRMELAQLLQGTRDAPVQVPKLFPKYIRAPNGPEANPVKQLLPDGEDSYLDVEVQLKRERAGAGRGGDSFLEWWVVRLKEATPSDGNILPMIIFNDKVSPPSLGFLAGYGIMGLYVSIVLVIGKFVRGFFSEISHSIMFEELPCVDRILKLCQDIFLVRETGELELEEELYAKLIFLYRSPETMIKWTREKE
ncbi:LOW QUALITY PROTEIN: piezo-type mechanosensitive ion channel component 1 [Aquila chrysaetos chrysaetos]|uniref:LOW QUALITY PROTEIN: piezo-type mechanosensitive ion channel component 1 n=1 Tax=Aquila chrysaetos chrysaetos TaxID=223781 RepID=UPI0011772905|nr:LOW QUALITY PROTEIN: piezo-type mechanosensitive ion channel component 1 [Aquila chrysaetos chrysaetos]